ncbi:hypothetical protein HK098_004383 [Nowakowskiella sp. JEL0407]|nr:hypothetical protein HK098_004383 [Nowakowskiella sp. JEL0407]
MYQADKQVITFAVSAVADGWVGMGIGNGMSDANYWIGWAGPAGAGFPVVSERSSKAEAMPVPVPPVILSRNSTTALWADFPLIPTHKTRFVIGRFLAPAVATSKNIIAGRNNSYLWAYSATKPTTPTLANSVIRIHSQYGKFSFDFTKDPSVSSAGVSTQVAVIPTPTASSDGIHNFRNSLSVFIFMIALLQLL